MPEAVRKCQMAGVKVQFPRFNYSVVKLDSMDDRARMTYVNLY